MQRFYVDNIIQPTTEITGQEARHIASVFRLRENDRIELINGNGTLALATIIQASPKRVSVNIETITKQTPKQTNRIVIASAISKGDRFDWMIAKCTELGADRISPIVFQRTVKQPKNKKILDRWKNLTISAAKQCKRLFLPQIDLPATLEKVIETLKADFPNASLLVGSLSEDTAPILNINIADKDIIAVIGPEGGFTDTETQFLQKNNAQFIRLTDTILRTETAAIAFTAILSALTSK